MLMDPTTAVLYILFYVVGLVVGLLIFYRVAKAAVRNGMTESRQRLEVTRRKMMVPEDTSEGWKSDPKRANQWRWWLGTVWSNRVMREDGVEGLDWF